VAEPAAANAITLDELAAASRASSVWPYIAQAFRSYDIRLPGFI
jgi:hypothetical protein